MGFEESHRGTLPEIGRCKPPLAPCTKRFRRSTGSAIGGSRNLSELSRNNVSHELYPHPALCLSLALTPEYQNAPADIPYTLRRIRKKRLDFGDVFAQVE